MNFAEDNALLAAKIGTASSTPLVTSYVSAANAGRITLVASLGDMANETIDIAIYQATDTSGTSAKSAKAATQLAASASANDNKQVIVSINAADLDVDNGFSCVAARCVTGNTTGGTVNLELWGSELKYAPAANVDNASVVQVVP